MYFPRKKGIRLIFVKTSEFGEPSPLGTPLEDWDGCGMCYVMGERTDVYMGLVGKPERKRPHGRPRRRWEDCIAKHVKEIVREGMDWSDLAQDGDKWRTVINTALNVRCASNVG
jgi:hypothetical protein